MPVVRKLSRDVRPLQIHVDNARHRGKRVQERSVQPIATSGIETCALEFPAFHHALQGRSLHKEARFVGPAATKPVGAWEPLQECVCHKRKITARDAVANRRLFDLVAG